MRTKASFPCSESQEADHSEMFYIHYNNAGFQFCHTEMINCFATEPL